jgi:hypothetical protein
MNSAVASSLGTTDPWDDHYKIGFGSSEKPDKQDCTADDDIHWTRRYEWNEYNTALQTSNA